MMKKIFPVLLSAALICGTFTACGSKDEKGTNTTESATMATDETSGLNSATDASIEDASNNPTEGSRMPTAVTRDETSPESSNGIVDDLVSAGEDIVSDAGSAVKDAGDALTGDR